MSEVSIIGLDIAKHVFQAHGVDALGLAVIRWRYWDNLLAVLGQRPCPQSKAAASAQIGSDTMAHVRQKSPIVSILQNLKAQIIQNSSPAEIANTMMFPPMFVGIGQMFAALL